MTLSTHLVSTITPDGYFSVADGKIYSACLFYTYHFVVQVCTFLFDLKYAIVAVERTRAFNYRLQYQLFCSSRFAWHYVLKVTLFSILVVTIKCVIIYNLTSGDDIDRRLQQTFIFEEYYYGFITAYVFAGTSVPYAIFKFYILNKTIQRSVNEERNLSAQYVVRQVQRSLTYVKRLIIVFTSVIVFCGICMVMGMYFYYGCNEKSFELRIVNCIIYIVAGLYNISCNYYLVLVFPQLQRAVGRDFKMLRKYHDNSLAIVPLAKETNIYFEQLQASWG
ncbi:unnamed protein product [Bursaphelenchus okinawaensis]|uniref:G_PROTEIN_RECEP_F1_2 domain-containing protein n=1 Tax=Bursaphelenchus okinawaensis TaxID=465554 RepID=A0A811KX28_9BILA|nr:unnamed protein product [Bursaphelenchus okinawaensis]CAG9113121.1 unnamed protein product [Bursaphelenchus okinawaensis]